VSDFSDFAKKGYKQATAQDYPLPSFLMYRISSPRLPFCGLTDIATPIRSPVVFKFYQACEPIAVRDLSSRVPTQPF
jgi:hypothetical protein